MYFSDVQDIFPSTKLKWRDWLPKSADILFKLKVNMVFARDRSSYDTLSYAVANHDKKISAFS